MATNTINDLYADDLQITIDQQGDGRPVLLLHGGGGPPSMDRFPPPCPPTSRSSLPYILASPAPRDQTGTTGSTTSR